MDKEVVTADVDKEEEFLYKVFKLVNLLWLYGLILGETLEEARKISLDQGNHEHEVTCGGEADLHRHLLRCKKNPGHRKFIPVQDFRIEHLPLSHRNNHIYDFIRATADMTCRLLVRYTSEKRPKYHPFRKHLLYPFSNVRGDFIRTGTGYVNEVTKYTEEDNKNCECDVCKRPGTHTPHKVWGKVIVYTATHVVYDNDEARRTTCYFGYDTSTTLLYKCIKLTGFRLKKSDVFADVSSMTYITHDMDIINKLVKMHRYRCDIYKELLLYSEHYFTLNARVTAPDPSPVVIISHPHGCSKQISVGIWTQRQTWGEMYKTSLHHTNWETDVERTSYTYNTHTCPGSSGAPVFRLPEKGMFWMMTPHLHSEGGKKNNNNNNSVIMSETVSPIFPRGAITKFLELLPHLTGSDPVCFEVTL